MHSPRSTAVILAIVAAVFLARPSAADVRTWRDSSGKVHMSNIDMPDLPVFRNSSSKTNTSKKPARQVYRAPRAFRNPSGVSERYDELIRDASQRFGVDYRLIKAVIHAESAFNHRAVSRKGALGLMQLMPGTARDLRVSDPFDPRQNVYGGTRYLKQMLRRYSNDISLCLAAYNAGPLTVERYGGVPPYRETQSYIRKVKALMRRYEQQTEPVRNDIVYRVVKNGKEIYSSNPLP